MIVYLCKKHLHKYKMYCIIILTNTYKYKVYLCIGVKLSDFADKKEYYSKWQEVQGNPKFWK